MDRLGCVDENKISKLFIETNIYDYQTHTYY